MVEPQPGAELILGVVAGGHRVAAVVDGWGGQTSGLDEISGESGESNASTHSGIALTPRKPNLIVVTVRGDSISLNCDGKTIIDWQGPFDRLNPSARDAAADRRALFIAGGGNSAFRIRKLRLATLSGSGRVIGDPAIAAPDLARVEPPLEMPDETPPGGSTPSDPPPDSSSQPETPAEPPVRRPPDKPREPAEPVQARAAVPAKAEIDEASKLVREVFADDFKQAKKSAEKIALAEKLVKQSGDSQTDTERFALLSEARVLALGGGNPVLAIEVVQETAARFEIDGPREIAELAEQLGKDTLPPAMRKELAEALLPLADGAWRGAISRVRGDCWPWPRNRPGGPAIRP